MSVVRKIAELCDGAQSGDEFESILYLLKRSRQYRRNDQDGT
jgi:hypothetical protein